MMVAVGLWFFTLTINHKVAAAPSHLSPPIPSCWNPAALRPPPHMPITHHTYLLKFSRAYVVQGGQAICPKAMLQ